jgi:membrane-bound serine protease (ClpP class)
MTVFAVALVVTGALLLIAEAHVASYGVLGVVGALTLAAGLALSLAAGGAGVAIAVAVATALAGSLGVLTLVATRAALRMRRRRALGGGDGLIGRIGVVRRPLTPVGVVMVMGELWRARPAWSDVEPAPAEGEDIVVEDVHGLVLRVRRAEDWEVDP